MTLHTRWDKQYKRVCLSKDVFMAYFVGFKHGAMAKI